MDTTWREKPSLSAPYYEALVPREPKAAKPSKDGPKPLRLWTEVNLSALRCDSSGLCHSSGKPDIRQPQRVIYYEPRTSVALKQITVYCSYSGIFVLPLFHWKGMLMGLWMLSYFPLRHKHPKGWISHFFHEFGHMLTALLPTWEWKLNFQVTQRSGMTVAAIAIDSTPSLRPMS